MNELTRLHCPKLFLGDALVLPLKTRQRKCPSDLLRYRGEREVGESQLGRHDVLRRPCVCCGRDVAAAVAAFWLVQ